MGFWQKMKQKNTISKQQSKRQSQSFGNYFKTSKVSNDFPLPDIPESDKRENGEGAPKNKDDISSSNKMCSH